jgi:hypothetical protein
MKHTIVKMNHKFEYTENKVFISLDGYAFIDENGGTIIIVYGEGRRDDMSKYLSSEGDPLGLKYKIITLS